MERPSRTLALVLGSPDRSPAYLVLRQVWPLLSVAYLSPSRLVEVHDEGFAPTLLTAAVECNLMWHVPGARSIQNWLRIRNLALYAAADCIKLVTCYPPQSILTDVCKGRFQLGTPPQRPSSNSPST